MICKYCKKAIYGGKGDYWHVTTKHMRCDEVDGGSLSQPEKTTEIEQSLPCVMCGKELLQVLPDYPDSSYPSDGTTFVSHGNYGSTVWEPIDYGRYEYLELNFCDPCLLRLSGEGKIEKVATQTQRPILTREEWRGDDPGS
jgi:hypothetical protein